MSRLVAHGTWYMLPRKGLQKFIRVPGGQTGGVTVPKPAGHTQIALT